MIASDSGHLAAELIARDLADIGQASAPERGGLKAQVRSRARSFQKSVSRLTRRSPSNPAYIAQKFPPTPGAELATRLAAFAGLLGRPAPRVEEVSDRIYRITSIEPDAGA